MNEIFIRSVPCEKKLDRQKSVKEIDKMNTIWRLTKRISRVYMKSSYREQQKNPKITRTSIIL